ncbi:MAG: substrate-binding domain-containing protein [Anaerolineae bacterium]
MKRAFLFTLISLIVVGLVFLLNGAVCSAEEPYEFVFITHGGEENVFWAAVYKGMTDACAKYEVKCEMFRPKTEGDLAAQLSFFQATLALKPDGIATTIPHESMYDDVVKQAIDAGIPVLAVNTDDPEGAKGNARLAYVGQDLKYAGYVLAKEASKYFPEEPHVMIGIEGPGLVWAEQRKSGIIQFLEEQGIKDYTIQELSLDFADDESRTVAYLKAHPETNVIFTVGTGTAPAAWAAKRLGYKPGDIVIGGFDLIPEIIEQIDAGYVTLTIDQQPYLQGYLPVVQLYMMRKYGFSAWDVNTGNGVVDKSNYKLIEELSKERIR